MTAPAKQADHLYEASGNDTNLNRTQDRMGYIHSGILDMIVPGNTANISPEYFRPATLLYLSESVPHLHPAFSHDPKSFFGGKCFISQSRMDGIGAE